MNFKDTFRTPAVELAMALISALLFVPAPAEAQRHLTDFRPAWACGSRSDAGGIITSIVRELDMQGKQLSIGVQWFLSGFDGNRLGISAILAAEGGGELPLGRVDLVATWSGFPQWDEGRPWIAVLHPADEVPDRADGKPAFEYSGGLLGMMVPWRRVMALSAAADPTRLSLVDGKGRVIRSEEIDLRRIEEALARTRAGLMESRRKATHFEQRCDPITEWLTF